MKKTLALILAVVMCIGMATAAFGINVTLSIAGWDLYDANGNHVDGDFVEWMDGTITYVAGSEFYIDPAAWVPNPEGDDLIDDFEITKAEVKQGSTTVYTPAFFYDDEGNDPLDAWVVQMKTKDIAAVKEYDTILHIEGKWFDADDVEYKVAGDIRLVVKDYDMITENDINKARIDDADVNTAHEDGGYKYVVSADAFKAIKSGETFKFPYDGYTLTVGSGIKNALNFRASIEKIDAIVEKYGEDKVLGILDFKDKNELPVEIGVDMECTEFSNTHKTNVAYVYRVEGDKLVLITDKATYNAERDSVSFKTNKLGTLVISAEPLTDAKAETTEAKKNPGTGANDVVGLAVAGAVVAMAAGFVALKK